MKFTELLGGLIGRKPKAPEAAPLDADAARLASLTAAQGNVETQAAAPGLATPAAATPPEVAPAAPVTAAPTPLK